MKFHSKTISVKFPILQSDDVLKVVSRRPAAGFLGISKGSAKDLHFFDLNIQYTFDTFDFFYMPFRGTFFMSLCHDKNLECLTFSSIS